MNRVFNLSGGKSSAYLTISAPRPMTLYFLQTPAASILLPKPYIREMPPILGNCDRCVLKGKNSFIKRMALASDLADKWIDVEKRPGNTFFPDVSQEQLLAIAKKPAKGFQLRGRAALLPCHSY